MPTTPRAVLRYPLLTDSPNVPRDLQFLAEDADAQLYRAFPCTSGSRPTAPLVGMIIRESDTGKYLGWSGTAWEQIGGDAGGGGAATVVADAQYSASVDQSIPKNTETVVAFGAAQLTTSYVNRLVRGAGHEFELTIGGLWSVSATLRYPGFSQGPTGSLRSRLMTTASAVEPVVEDEIHDDPRPTTLFWSTVRRFPPGARLYISTRNTTVENRPLDRGVNGSTVRLNLALVGR